MKNQFTLAAALKEKNHKAIEFVYWDFFPSVQKYILLHGGKGQDAEDVFQEALIILLNKLQKPDFTLTSSLKTFHFSICKNIWNNKLKQIQRFRSISSEHFLDEWQEENESHLEEQWNSVEVVMKRITGFCSKFLADIFLEGRLPHYYKNEHTFHNQKYKCLLQARKAAKKIQLNG